MTPAEALEHQRKGGKLYEYISPRVTWTFDADAYYQARGTKVVCFTIPATIQPTSTAATPRSTMKKL